MYAIVQMYSHANCLFKLSNFLSDEIFCINESEKIQVDKVLGKEIYCQSFELLHLGNLLLRGVLGVNIYIYNKKSNFRTDLR